MATDRDLGLLAENCFFELEGNVFPQIGTTLGAAAATSATAEEVPKTEEVAEDFAEILEHGGIKTGGSGPANRGVAKAVVGGAFFGIRQDGIGFAAFLEFLFRVGIIRIPVRMELQRQLAIGTLDFLLGGLARDSEYLVIIAFYITGQNCSSNPFE
jgi:hypothetical protein